jgi:hypothetical protein
MEIETERKEMHNPPLTRWPETFKTAYLRCPKCGRGQLKCRKTKSMSATAQRREYVCRTCSIIIPAVAIMAQPA